MGTSEVELEAVVGNSVAVIAAAPTPAAVLGIPRLGARLDEPAAHLPLVLWDAARVDAAIGGAVGLHAAMIDAAEGLLRAWRRSRRRLPILWLGGLRLTLLLLLRFARLLMLLRCGCSLLMLLILLRFARLLFVLLALCVGRSNGSEEQTQGPCADSEYHRHAALLFKRQSESWFVAVFELGA
jgi:hypothetical protein